MGFEPFDHISTGWDPTAQNDLHGVLVNNIGRHLAEPTEQLVFRVCVLWAAIINCEDRTALDILDPFVGKSLVLIKEYLLQIVCLLYCHRLHPNHLSCWKPSA